MNERIKELAKQAGITDNNLSDGNMSLTELEKFAELFVRECAEWLKTTDSDPDIGEADAKALLEHFGVE